MELENEKKKKSNPTLGAGRITADFVEVCLL